jgi:hypothetical protein
MVILIATSLKDGLKIDTRWTYNITYRDPGYKGYDASV